jgi:molecular chaperone GrpE
MMVQNQTAHFISPRKRGWGQNPGPWSHSFMAKDGCLKREIQKSRVLWTRERLSGSSGSRKQKTRAVCSQAAPFLFFYLYIIFKIPYNVFTMDEDITLEEEVNEDGEITPDVVKKLRERLKKCVEEKQEYLAGWQRSKADFINARKEEEENRHHFVKFSERNLIMELLVLLDSFDQLFKSNPEDEGTRNIHKQLLSILKTRGVEPIESLNKDFNPEEHESIGEIKVDSKEKENKIIEEIRKGYKMHNKIIRPSKVKIGKYE